MRYKDIILLYEPPYFEYRKEIVKTLYAGMLLLSSFLYGYSYLVEMAINNAILGTRNTIHLTNNVGLMFVIVIIICVIARIILCRETRDLFYWRIPGQLYLSGTVIILQYMLFVMVNYVFPNKLPIILISYFVGILFITSLMIIFIKKGKYSLHNQKNVTGFYAFGLAPGFLGLISAKANFMSEEIKIMIPIYLLAMLLFPVLPVGITSIFVGEKFSRKEMLYARLEKNALYSENVKKAEGADPVNKND